MTEPYVTPGEAAAYLKCSKATVLRKAGSRQLPCYRPNPRRVLFKLSEIDEAMQKHKVTIRSNHIKTHLWNGK